MKIEEALVLIDRGVPKGLNTIQELVVRHTLEDKTYHEIAEICGYDASYIRDVGYQLWRTLSKSFGEKVKKGNLQVILRRQSQKALQEQMSSRQVMQQGFSPYAVREQSDRTSEFDAKEVSLNNSNVIDFQKAVVSKQREVGNTIAVSVQLEDIGVEDTLINDVTRKLDELRRNGANRAIASHNRHQFIGLLHELQACLQG
ncbi:hypothetical protein V2H45_00525 [Tumidithrix elongata RA019]|uniref:vWA-MoxR associated protein N-terminal HTH domain-containing protein n=1 Tax=Tumidithrix elongata BACA0141 TaxID=2716417 RepID=A0AAW9PPK7_9CYAN|nr:hypothetical protein [Tumidithrix elongata RA019]